MITRVKHPSMSYLQLCLNHLTKLWTDVRVMTSWNGNFLRVTDLLCGEFTHRAHYHVIVMSKPGSLRSCIMSCRLADNLPRSSNFYPWAVRGGPDRYGYGPEIIRYSSSIDSKCLMDNMRILEYPQSHVTYEHIITWLLIVTRNIYYFSRNITLFKRHWQTVN